MNFCVYETIYLGDKLPTYYIGSSTVKKVKECSYHGSVKSKKYKTIWLAELRENSHLFITKILSLHETKNEVQNEELRIQKQYDVVNHSNFINQSLAKPNGFFGSDTSGKNNGMFGKHFKHPNHQGRGKLSE